MVQTLLSPKLNAVTTYCEIILEGFVVSHKRQKTKVVQFLLFYERRCLTNNSIFELLALELCIAGIAQKYLSIHKKIEKLKHEIYNGPFHVCGDHTGCPQTQSFIDKGLTNNSPGSINKAHIQRKERTAEKRKRTRMDNSQKLKRRKQQMSGPNSDYGCIELGLPNMEPGIATKGQSDSLLWKAERLKRLTAFHFDTICKMKKSTERGKSVVNILYSRFSGTAATRYGLKNERNAIEDFEFKSGKKVARCVLFVDLKYPWLAASPDGLVGDDSILEVKCPAVDSRLTPEKAVKEKKVKFCNIVDGKMFLKEEHAYMYQVQGQLHIANRKYCFFLFFGHHMDH
ncbi:hypothetical protein PR048_017919 [Dryococelus australis]|uniref:YqaJ viral recombinase domain-containing protein n=1 Tax=Dryococelus australis TaxID=614101 RepID=A0ABQ9HBF2_9NEOP|nr:hypothetical protein PR048_017919 [Dryococelus australis]